jgi:FMN phosphatase YigB (HAD superfamily)
VAALADALVLSNEAGAVKPAAQIFKEALDRVRPALHSGAQRGGHAGQPA